MRPLLGLLLLLTVNGTSALELRSITGIKPILKSSTDVSSLPDALPDAEVILGTGTIKRAWLVFPTDRYDHAILGDDIEAAGVRVELDTHQVLTYTLPDDSVFEDRYPRLVDLDGDGTDEMILVRSYLNRGAALMVLKIKDGKIIRRAEAEPIGLSHRWLNPVGVGDFDQDGQPELAVVITPHIGGILTLYKLVGERLEPVFRMPGFSNHRIGSSELGQSAIIDFNQDGVPDLVVPAVGFHDLRVISVVNGMLKEISRVTHSSPINTPIEVKDLDGDGDQDLTYGLIDGRQIQWILP